MANNITIHLCMSVYCDSIQQRLGAKIKYLDVKIPNFIILKTQITRNLIFVKLNNGGACRHVWSTACSEIKKIWYQYNYNNYLFIYCILFYRCICKCKIADRKYVMKYVVSYKIIIYKYTTYPYYCICILYYFNIYKYIIKTKFIL